MFVRLRGFEVQELLWEGPRYWTFKAIRHSDGRALAVKLARLVPSQQSAAESLRFESQLAADLDGVVPRPLELLHLSSGVVLVHELPVGAPLSRMMAVGMGLDEVLQVGRAVCRCLGALHARGAVHNDLRPNGIFFDRDRGTALLMDLSAALFPSRGGGDSPLALSERDLSLVAPEQTGRTSRTVDHRADLYALGVILYEAVCGELPFEASDPASLIHAHLAGPSQPLRERLAAFPDPVGQIILKLLSKSPERRYRGAFGLGRDFEACATELNSHGTIAPFELARRDPSSRPEAPAHLYGRDGAIASLRAAADRAGAGPAQLVTLRGESGTGKTGTVNAAFSSEPRFQLAEAKGDVVAREAPYGVILQACRSLVKQLVAHSAASVARWKAALDQQDKDAAPVLLELLPELALVVGPQPAAPPAELAERQYRVEHAFQAFFAACTQPGQTVVLFLDDMDRADAGTLSLLTWLLREGGLRHLLVVVAWRDGGGADPELVRALREALHLAGPPLDELVLGPLSLDDTRAMVGAILDDSAADLPALARIVRDRTGGNPHFVLEFVRRLHAERLVTFDSQAGEWRVDLPRIRESAATDNVRDLMMLRMKAIPPEARKTLLAAACLAQEIDSETLVGVLGDDRQALAHLEFLAREGFLVDLDDDPSGRRPRFRFVHDRVREAALLLLGEEQRGATHLAVGRYIMVRLGGAADMTDADLYAAAHQLNAGLRAVTDARERSEIGLLHLRAGERALATAAFGDAFHYLSVAVELLPAADGVGDAAAMLAAHLGLGRCGYLCARPEDSERHFQLALGRARTRVEHAEIHADMVPFYAQRGQGQRALWVCIEGLRALGIRLPANPGGLRVLGRAVPILWRIWRVGPDGLARLPPMTDPERLAAMRLLMNACLPATTLARPPLVALIALEMMNLTLEHGACGESAFAYVLIAIFGVRLGWDDRAYRMGRLALDLARRSANGNIESWVLMFFAGFLSHLRNHLAESISLFERGYLMCLRIGEHLQATMLLSGMVSLMPSTGHPIPTLHDRATEGVLLGRRLGHAQSLVSSRAVLKWTASLAGLVQPPEEPIDRELISAQEDASWQLRLVEELLNVQAQYLLGHYAEAHASARVTLRRPYVVRLSSCYREFFAFYYALTLAALLDDNQPPPRARRSLARARRFLERVAARCPANGLHRHALVAAEVARLEGRHEAAVNLYGEAIAAAAANAFPHEEALAHELAGRFHMRLGQPKVGLRHLRAAREGYETWGATNKVARLDAELSPVPLAPVDKEPPALDLDSVIRSSRAISGEIVLKDLIARLMSIVIENAGAERGLLLLNRDGRLMIEAEGAIGQRSVALSPTPAEGDPRVPWSIVNYVGRTGESLVLADALETAPFRSDPYVVCNRPKSVLAAPLYNQGRLMALIYMENNLGVGVFTSERLQIITLLLAQAALSLHNASLYADLKISNARLEESNRTLEAKVDERTRELHQTQRQLVTHEKLASLGTITAGIAHELRNPLNFVSNFAELSEGLLDDLQAQLGDSSAPAPPGDEEPIRDIIATLKGNAARIREHGKRANGIIGSMLQHARSSNAAREDADLASLVTESITLAVQGARGQMPGLDVQVDQHHDPRIGTVNVRVQDIQRVLLNLINNACYAVWQKQREQPGVFVPTISVATRERGDRVELRVRDNGNGISPQIADRIFTPFLTTKAPGEGTGLGLSLSHDIVVQGHGGEMFFESVPGQHTEVVLRLPKAPPGNGRQAGGVVGPSGNGV